MLFGLPFALIGLIVLGIALKNGFDYLQMKSWVPLKATVTSADLKTNYNDDSTTYEAVATYEYEIDGKKYLGDRVGLTSGADNIGSFQEDSAKILKSHLESKNPITIYVDPNNHSKSVIFRELRSGQFTLTGLFGLIFFSVGFGIVYAARWAKKDQKIRESLRQKFPNQPWRANPNWQTDTLRNNNSIQFLGVLFFGGLWNLISIPILFLVPQEVFVEKNYIAAIAFIFPIIGIVFLGVIYKYFIKWKRFGRTFLTLNPFPAELEGQLKGVLKISSQLDSNTKNAKGIITCSRMERHRNSKGSTVLRPVKIWSKEFPLLIDTYRVSSQNGNGTNATFSIELPDSKVTPPTDEDAELPIKWEIEFSAEIPGVDFSSSFEIPVIKK